MNPNPYTLISLSGLHPLLNSSMHSRRQVFQHCKQELFGSMLLCSGALDVCLRARLGTDGNSVCALDPPLAGSSHSQPAPAHTQLDLVGQDSPERSTTDC